MLIDEVFELSELRRDINQAYYADETDCVRDLISKAGLDSSQLSAITSTAEQLIHTWRTAKQNTSGIEFFLQQYRLSSDEGIALMCLSEALLRIPDKKTIDKLLHDKLHAGNWRAHLGQSDSLYVNAATWGLMLTGKLFTESESHIARTLNQLLKRSSLPTIRRVILAAMKIISEQFIMGQHIEQALARGKNKQQRGYRFSFDMLGEAALTQADAIKYQQAYAHAIDTLGQQCQTLDIAERPGISIKLSALHPRYEHLQAARVIDELTPVVLNLCLQASKYSIDLTIDAEEANRLDLSLDIIERVIKQLPTAWQGFGVAVQAYQKRGLSVLVYLGELAKLHQRRIKIRLIKGAYWDSEIKAAQQLGVTDYPVFTRKVATDVSYLACAKQLLALREHLYPQFATHNAYTVATVLHLAGDYRDFEFQCLHGMGQGLYQQIVEPGEYQLPCRVYAPVGSHQDLLPYLVRRLLENGANTSFVNQLHDEPLADLTRDPVTHLQQLDSISHPRIPKPPAIYPWPHAQGLDLSDRQALLSLSKCIQEKAQTPYQSGPIIHGEESIQTAKACSSPTNTQHIIGYKTHAKPTDLHIALDVANNAYTTWSQQSVNVRAEHLERIAAALNAARDSLIYLLITEAGKTISDAINEVREAIDFCYYYAHMARKQLSPVTLPSVTGEDNTLHYMGRGVMVCISPWNFPLAIFCGQVLACLVAGNTVLAKSADQTTLIAAFAIRLMHRAGIPVDVLQFIPCSGALLSEYVIARGHIAGVLFTGSTETAQTIAQTLAMRKGALVPLIAETGGQNAMIVDSSALLEQVIPDVLTSAFGTSGQRCLGLSCGVSAKRCIPTIL